MTRFKEVFDTQGADIEFIALQYSGCLPRKFHEYFCGHAALRVNPYLVRYVNNAITEFLVTQICIELVHSLVLCAQSVTKDYIRAEHTLQSILKLFIP